MQCEECKKDFNPRKQEPFTSGYDDVMEVRIYCPHCNSAYSAWIEPEQWARQENN